MVKGGTMNLLIITLVGKNDTKNFRRSTSSNADENRGLSDRHGRNWDLGIFFYSRKIKSTLNSITNYGKRFGRKYGVPYQMAEGVTSAPYLLIPNNLC